MPYSTQADVQIAAGGPARLVELTDQANTGAVDTTVLNAAIAAADATIDSYLQQAAAAYALPLIPAPQKIKDTSADEAVYILLCRRLAVTPEIEKQHAERIHYLEQIRDGKITFGVDPATVGAPVSTVGTPKYIDRAGEDDCGRLYTRDSLKGGLW